MITSTPKIEAKKIGGLNLAVIPKRQYDPNNVAFNFTTQVKVKQFIHEKDEFDHFFRLAETFSQVHHLAKIKLEPGKMDQFIQYRTQRLQTVPLDLLNIAPVIQQTSQSTEQEKTSEVAKTNEKEIE